MVILITQSIPRSIPIFFSIRFEISVNTNLITKSDIY